MRSLTFLLSLVLVLSPARAYAQVATSGSGASDAISLQPGDVVRIQIWREEDLSGDFLVDEEGIVTLPLLGNKRVVGIPMRALRDTLLEGYRAQLRNPSITVTPLRRINVLGEVQKPGLYPVDPTVSLAGAIALAGGATATGDLTRIRVIRGGTVIQERASAASTLNTIDIRSGDQIIVDRRSWFERNSTFVVSVLLSVTSIVINLTR